MRHIQRGIPLMRARVVLHTVIVTVLVAAMTSCAKPGALGPSPEPSTATLVVQNDAFLDVNVYAVRSGQRIRLGTVTGHTTRTFTVPRTLVGTGAPVRFQADFIGSQRSPVSEEVIIWAGEEVQLVIPAS